MKRWLIVFLFVVFFTFSKAQELWLQPQLFFSKAGEKFPLSLRSGDGFHPAPYTLLREQVNKVSLHHLASVTDLKANLKDGSKDQLEVTFSEEGTQLITLQTNSVVSTVEAEKFNEYVKSHGLDEVYFKREQAGALNKPVQERSSYYTKVLMQTGEGADDTFKKVVGFPLEIIVERNPYSLKPGEAMPFTILWQGKPLFGAQVKIWNIHNNLTTQQSIYTQQDGRMETRVSNAGLWLVSVVQMVPSKQAGVDWISYRSSLVFSIR